MIVLPWTWLLDIRLWVRTAAVSTTEGFQEGGAARVSLTPATYNANESPIYAICTNLVWSFPT